MTVLLAHTNAWRGKVTDLLREGYGVEDIAIKLRCDVKSVRMQVRSWRENGDMEFMFPNWRENLFARRLT